MKSIQLLGIPGDHTYEIWKARIEEVIKELPFKGKVEEVNSVDEIVRAGLDSIPGLLVNRQVILQQNNHLPDAEEIRTAIKNFLIKKRQMMKKIIIPTDFSQTAHNAFLYAEALSDRLGNPLKVINVAHPSTDSIDGVTAPMMSDLMNFRKEKLEKFVNIENAAPGNSLVAVLCETEVIPGLAKSEIIELSKKENTEMIVMGSTGERGVLIDFLGSISTGVSQQAKCPVWLIPPGAKFEGINHILFASNFESADEKIVLQAVKLAEQFDAMIEFVHVEEKNEQENFSETEGKIFDRLFANGEPSFPFQMKSIKADSVVEGLNAYAKNKAVDLIVIANRQRNFWQSLIGQSTTKKMTLNIKKPTLVYHI